MTKPPRHLADLDPPARRAAAAQLGEPPFRGDQLSRHYFARLTDEPDQMTDLPAAERADRAEHCARQAVALLGKLKGAGFFAKPGDQVTALDTFFGEFGGVRKQQMFSMLCAGLA